MGKMIVHNESKLSRENLQELFRSMVRGAIETQRATPSAMAEYYLVCLLSEAAVETVTPDKTLAEIHLKADSLPPSEKEEALRKMGDHALFVSGFFAESLARKNVGPGYFRRMGSIAYSRLANEIDVPQLYDLFTELSRDFPMFVEVLGEVSENTGTGSSRQVMALYEKWIWTRSASAYKRLVKEGIQPCFLEAGTIQ